ncbi:hypothetical protein D8674_002851 [Pyrus ussuriensis x Pyrus communis]|uniref:Uncharacterized protein n=1 Tax=Pyrus ussuriensis x Pyrus communis TaxID=2448454 RepID=A0A5N5FFF7_9ROSA|nr:hypothetical protein D8674_002851 [Pyrus ussuriensis x Pyrus communis]
MQADMEALMATNKRPENRLRPKFSLLSKTLLERNSSQFPKTAVTSRNEKS